MYKGNTHVCIECYGDGFKHIKDNIQCALCSGKGYIFCKDTFGYPDTIDCSGCNGKGYIDMWLNAECHFCKGTGIRTWVDHIKRPSKKEKEICYV